MTQDNPDPNENAPDTGLTQDTGSDELPPITDVEKKLLDYFQGIDGENQEIAQLKDLLKQSKGDHSELVRAAESAFQSLGSYSGETYTGKTHGDLIEYLGRVPGGIAEMVRQQSAQGALYEQAQADLADVRKKHAGLQVEHTAYKADADGKLDAKDSIIDGLRTERQELIDQNDLAAQQVPSHCSIELNQLKIERADLTARLNLREGELRELAPYKALIKQVIIRIDAENARRRNYTPGDGE